MSNIQGKVVDLITLNILRTTRVIIDKFAIIESYVNEFLNGNTSRCQILI